MSALMVKIIQKKNKLVFDIVVQNETPNAFVPSAAKIRRWVVSALSEKVRGGELVIRTVSKKEMTRINGKYRHKERPTNILSFPTALDDFPALPLTLPPLGDIVICPAVVNKEAQQQAKTKEAHWAHIVIHGGLHILGFDHEISREAKLMEAKEIKLLKKLKVKNPYE